jgi:glucose/arabinose dehydrogenase
MNKKNLVLILIIFSGCMITTTDSTEFSEGYTYEIIKENIASGWGMDFISENELIISLKEGILKILNLETLEFREILGVPEVSVIGQGGLLDVKYDEEYVYITYSYEGVGGYATHLGRGLLNRENYALENFEVLHIATPFMNSGAHFGSRILIDGKYIYYTVGDRGDKTFISNHVSQNKNNYLDIY